MSRKLTILTFLTLDGVMQAPGAPEEDTSGGFKYGGWTVNYMDDFLGNIMNEQINGDFDLLLGRRTYEIFAAYWPFADIEKNSIAAGFNKAKKYVVSNSLHKLEWSNSFLINNNAAAAIQKLKEENGPEIQVHGSGNLIQTLLKHDLVDELRLKIFPLTLGSGKRLFADGTIPTGFTLTESKISPTGVIVADYKRAGEVKTGSFAMETPSESELTRREKHKKEN